MRTRTIFWGSNVDPVDVFGVQFAPPPSRPMQSDVVKVVDYEINATVVVCDHCKKQLFDAKQVKSLQAHGCMECLDYDLCNECYATINHPHPMYAYYGPPIEKFTGTTVQEGLLYAFRAHAGRPMVGVSDGTSLTWHSYLLSSKRFAAGLRTLNITPEFMAICGPNSLEYIVADYGAILCGFTVVPIHVPFGQSEVDYIIQSIEAECVICSTSVTVKFLNSMKANKCLKVIIQFEPSSTTPVEILARAKEQNVELLYFDEICTKGDVEAFVPTKKQADDLFSIYTFTSGSTGTPKGVMHTNKTVLAEITEEFSRYKIAVCIGPYAHSERQNMMYFFFNGARIGIPSGNMETLVEEIRQINPTSLNAVPRFWNMLYSQFKNEVAVLEKADPENAEIAPALVAEKFRTMLGSNLLYIVAGGAPTGEAVLDFLRTCFGVPVIDGYASTEAGSVSTNYRIDDDVEMKLVDWGDYTSNDKPFPRGEICVKTKYMAMGYWKDEKTTAEMFRDGWFHTGDIGEQEDPQHIRIVDRKKNLFKLAQGEFVAPEHVENTLLASKFVKQIFVTGLSTQSFLVAVIVPDRDAVLEWAYHSNLTETKESIGTTFSDTKLMSAIQSDLLDVGLKGQLPSFQIPRALYLYNKTFTTENSLLTASNKVNRPMLEKEFKGIVAELYEKTQLDTIDVSNRTDEQVLQEIVAQYAPGLDSPEESIFTFGVDSISAVQITSAIKQFFNVDIALRTLYENPTVSQHQ